MDVFDKLLAPRKHNGTKDSMFVCDDELGKQYTMAVVRKGGLADNRRQALLQVSRLFGCHWTAGGPAVWLATALWLEAELSGHAVGQTALCT